MATFLLPKYCTRLLLAAGILALAGCVTVPPEIQGTTATPQQSLATVMGAPSLYVGQEARFGGQILAVTNEKNRTRLEVSTVPLDAAARPQMGQLSSGRLVAYVNGFLEPTDFQGKWVTLVGPITGTEQGKVGDRPYTYVVIQANAYKRWQLVQQVEVQPQPFGPIGPWGWRHGRWVPIYGYGYGNGFYGFDQPPAKVETVLTE